MVHWPFKLPPNIWLDLMVKFNSGFKRTMYYFKRNFSPKFAFIHSAKYFFLGLYFAVGIGN